MNPLEPFLHRTRIAYFSMEIALRARDAHVQRGAWRVGGGHRAHLRRPAINAQRFAKLCRVAAKIARGDLLPDWRADVVHANDWHTGLLPIFLAEAGDERPATVFTIHNLGYQGLFPHWIMTSLGLPDHLFTPDGVEFYGQLSFLKAGIQFSDWITTVSPSYAREILTSEYGCGLDGLLRRRMHHMSGILNGVDYRIWDPWRDPHLPAKFRIGEMSGKRACKAGLAHECPGECVILPVKSMLESQRARRTVRMRYAGGQSIVLTAPVV